MLLGDEDKFYLLASDAGYGFVGSYKDMISRNKAGKALLTLPANSKVITPKLVDRSQSESILAITNEGRMLLFTMAALPQLSKGKGNKIIGIPGERAKTREELLSHLYVIPEDTSVTLWAGKRKLTLKPSDLEHYRGERGRRGAKLPRGLQRVDSVELGEGTPALAE